MYGRRAFLGLAAAAAPALLLARTTIFLPPRGGWPSNEFKDICRYLGVLYDPTGTLDMSPSIRAAIEFTLMRPRDEPRIITLPAGTFRIDGPYLPFSAA